MCGIVVRAIRAHQWRRAPFDIRWCKTGRGAQKGRPMRYRNIGMMLAAFAAVTTSPALATDCSQQAHLARPIPLGVSGGNINDFNKKQTACFGGTLGALIQNRSGMQFILSNNHVLAEENKARPGDPIVQ